MTSERCAVVASQQRVVRWTAVRSQSFWPTIKRGQRLLPWSRADGYFASGKLPAGRDVDASAWVDGRSLGGEVDIFEHAMTLPQLPAVLSFVWIPESCGPLAHRAA